MSSNRDYNPFAQDNDQGAPNVDFDFYSEKPERPANAKPPMNPKKKVIIVVAVLQVILAILCIIMIVIASSPMPEINREPSPETAYQMAAENTPGNVNPAEPVENTPLDVNAAESEKNTQNSVAEQQENSAVKQPSRADLIEQVFTRNKVQVRQCYINEFEKNGKFTGKLSVLISISPDGLVTNCDIDENTTGNDAFGKCVVEKILKWKFPSGDKTVVFKKSWIYN